MDRVESYWNDNTSNPGRLLPSLRGYGSPSTGGDPGNCRETLSGAGVIDLSHVEVPGEYDPLNSQGVSISLNNNKIQHRIWAFAQALVYCISELLEKVCCHELNFYQQFHFC